MILIISGIVTFVGLGVLIYGLFYGDTPDAIGAGAVLLLIGVLFGFIVLGAVVPVKTVTSIIPARIEVMRDTAVACYGPAGNDSLVTHDIRIIKNPGDYVVKKSVDYNSYNFPVGNSETYTIVEKDKEDIRKRLDKESAGL